jgi:hypothetical protein
MRALLSVAFLPVEGSRGARSLTSDDRSIQVVRCRSGEDHARAGWSSSSIRHGVAGHTVILKEYGPIRQFDPRLNLTLP